MKTIGITGGIACGKSTVTALLARWGARTASADDDARAVTAPQSPALEAVFTAFEGVRGADGTLDRARLGALVFADADARARLEAILHPAIFARMEAAVADARAASDASFLAYEVPLLFEKCREPLFDATVAVVCSEETQAARMRERQARAGRPPLTDAEIRERLAAQLPNAEKARRATHVINTDGTPADTEAQARALFRIFAGSEPPAAAV